MRASGRARLVAQILAGETSDGAHLGYELDRAHVAAIADTAEPLQELAAHSRSDLLLVAGSDEVWSWLSPARLPTEDELDQLVAWQRTRAEQVVFGEPALGVDGFRTSHGQAMDAWRVVRSQGSSETTRFADVALLVAVVRDRELARIFISRELGGLPPALQETARLYLEAGQNSVCAAALAGRSRRTIARQLRRVEAILGRPIHERAANLLIAAQTSAVARAEGWWRV
jgi:hypothetical protein